VAGIADALSVHLDRALGHEAPSLASRRREPEAFE
jgi:hypothetical protein